MTDIWDEFPFERVEWDNGQYLRLKGYHNSAMMQIFAVPLETWMEDLKVEWEDLKIDYELALDTAKKNLELAMKYKEKAEQLVRNSGGTADK